MSVPEEKVAEYARLLHAMQAGVAAVMERDDLATTPKHLRVGVNSCMVQIGALVKLLQDKGVFTEDEYWDALISALRTEVEGYEKMVSDLYGGAKITLV